MEGLCGFKLSRIAEPCEEEICRELVSMWNPQHRILKLKQAMKVLRKIMQIVQPDLPA